MLRATGSRAAGLLAEFGVEYDIVREIVRIIHQELARRAAIDERTGLILRETHHSFLDAIARSFNHGQATPEARQAVVLAIMDALSQSSMARQTFASADDLREQLADAAATKWPD
jgi:hypothetical protein